MEILAQLQATAILFSPYSTCWLTATSWGSQGSARESWSSTRFSNLSTEGSILMDNTNSCYFGSHAHERPLHNSVLGECKSSTAPEVTLDIHQCPAVSCSFPAHTVVWGFKAIQACSRQGQGSSKANGRLNYLFLNTCPKENNVLGKHTTRTYSQQRLNTNLFTRDKNCMEKSIQMIYNKRDKACAGHKTRQARKRRERSFPYRDR